jgi:hypothetical protein
VVVDFSELVHVSKDSADELSVVTVGVVISNANFHGFAFDLVTNDRMANKWRRVERSDCTAWRKVYPGKMFFSVASGKPAGVIPSIDERTVIPLEWSLIVV